MTSARETSQPRERRPLAGKIKLKSLANFSKQAAVTLRSGLTLSRALPLISRGSRDRRLKGALAGIQDDITQGLTLTDALRKRRRMFPPMFVELVAAGETSGRLEEVFSRLALYFDARLRIKRTVIRASVYPAILLIMAFSVLSLILILFSSDKVATATSLASTASLVITACIGSYIFFGRTDLGRGIRDRILVSVPVVRSITLKLCMARFSRSLAMQIESAVPMTEALERAASVSGNEAVANNLRRMSEPVRQGGSLTEAMKESTLVTPVVREVLMVGEETGSFTDSLERVADIYEDEAQLFLESLPKFITPVVVIIVGFVVVYLFYIVYYVHYLKPLLDSIGM
jgi:type II secretory pathway component PulF